MTPSPSSSSSSIAPTAINEWADFWRFNIGVNVIPADTKNKRTNIRWAEWQDTPIPEELYNQWKEQGAFSYGIAIIPGKVWHREDKKDQYFTFLDADKQKAIDELCLRNGKTTTLQEMAQKFIVEQHRDNLQKAHIYFYSPIPFPKKSSDSVLGLESKGLGEHGIAYCANSIHKDGQPYEIIGTTNPITLTADQAKELIGYIDQVCKKYNLEYLEKHYRNLLESDVKIYQGERNTSLISIANSLLFRYGGNGNGNSNGSDNLDPQLELELKNKFLDINNNRCEVPLPTGEINQIWKDAVSYYTKKKIENKRQQQQKKKTAAINAAGEAALAQDDDSKEVKAKEYTVFKYSQDNIPLAEEITIAGVNKFLQIVEGDDGSDKKKSVISDKIDLSEEKHIILKPHEQGTGSPIFPYTFANMDEINYFIKQAQAETIDSVSKA
jgi:hypothetical protein